MRLVQKDVIYQQVDAIVNPSKRNLDHKMGFSALLLREAGWEM